MCTCATDRPPVPAKVYNTHIYVLEKFSEINLIAVTAAAAADALFYYHYYYILHIRHSLASLNIFPYYGGITFEQE